MGDGGSGRTPSSRSFPPEQVELAPNETQPEQLLADEVFFEQPSTTGTAAGQAASTPSASSSSIPSTPVPVPVMAASATVDHTDTATDLPDHGSSNNLQKPHDDGAIRR